MSLIKTIMFIINHPLNKRNKRKSIIRYLKWQINSYLNPYKIIYPFTERSYLIVAKGMTGATGNVYCGLHEFIEMSFLLHFLRQDDLFVDIGANIGSYTILASAHVGAKTISFEPVPETFSILLQNIAINNVFNKVTTYNLAVGNTNGVINFTKDHDTMNHAAISSDSNVIEVKICKCDDILKNQNPTLLKIDVEGYETEVINGAFETLKKESLKAIIIELNGSGNRYGCDEKNIHEKLLAIGFYPSIYNPFTRQLKKIEPFKMQNTIYIRDFNFVNMRLLSGDKINIFNNSF
ncbi:MAG: FkbM family methyltransferase [Bacteroidales bacterium]|nr:FkbM family methyltransferase [Bacteroidales bacterium]